jgi:hypothetical protein
MQLLAIVQNFKAFRWIILGTALAAVAAELALGRSHAQIGLTVGAATILYWIVTEIERRL